MTRIAVSFLFVVSFALSSKAQEDSFEDAIRPVVSPSDASAIQKSGMRQYEFYKMDQRSQEEYIDAQQERLIEEMQDEEQRKAISIKEELKIQQLDQQKQQEFLLLTPQLELQQQLKIEAVIIDEAEIITEYESEALIMDESELDEARKALIGDETEEDDAPDEGVGLLGRGIDSSEVRKPRKKRALRGPSQYDSRIETRALDPSIRRQRNILFNARSVGMVVEREDLHAVGKDRYQLDIRTTLGNKYKLCSEEAFGDQPVAGLGTAFITGSEDMMTASHVFEGGIENYAIVFGFELVNRYGAYETLIPSSNIYYPKKVLKNNSELDIIEFRVDRPIHRSILKFKKNPDVKINTPVYMIGYPSGLPQKVALNASVKTNDHFQYFYTSLDAFQGNSGSPVFDMNTHEIIGVLVSGELDYRWNGSCNVSTLCRIPYCKGEKVIRITAALD